MTHLISMESFIQLDVQTLIFDADILFIALDKSVLLFQQYYESKKCNTLQRHYWQRIAYSRGQQPFEAEGRAA